MILEQAILYIKPGESEAFAKAFKEAQKIISAMKGYIRHDVLKCIEENDKYLLLVEWETIEDHETGFRKSEEYQEWKKLLHHFYDPFPVVQHYASILS
ncbi:heme-degrading monooxygenase HmoA [Aquimarina sp. EL_43]|uniref:antibiotic biosynthesis monooxygenase family protein n=1 Tax=Aquimarina TaxID=290174 RepID=UPI0004721C95|nr:MULTISPECIES: antibiotic biosynthesis monooxygenase [Aquimarina]MBG6132793.1 heme-degrading monooxygenase HmoA [Aquimarina sp. EL_35]MBG6153130.1 heme-degrading monooxygenase HmoA [Aquimarina sp. EL_32]MBG6171286.1 heme-degrading monooxygenase HmoA [Aquimarina sp. EL_43]